MNMDIFWSSRASSNIPLLVKDIKDSLSTQNHLHYLQTLFAHSANISTMHPEELKPVHLLSHTARSIMLRQHDLPVFHVQCCGSNRALALAATAPITFRTIVRELVLPRSRLLLHASHLRHTRHVLHTS